MNELTRKDQDYVWHPFTQAQTAPNNLEIIRAKDTLLYSADGKNYIDANSSWWVNVHGHGHPHIAAAIQSQFEQLDHVIFAGATHPKAVELAERVIQLTANDLKKVFFSDNGSTAVEVALKMAFQYWHNKQQAKQRILALEGAYHGDTFGAMSVGQRGYFNEPFEHLFFSVDFLAFPTLDNHTQLLQQAEDLFKIGDFAALILEPLLQGSAGMRTYSVSFLEQLVQLAKRYHVLVIFDEVMTAWGRTGTYFAFQHSTVSPDICCLSKGLTGGVLPLGLTLATSNIYDAFLSPEKTKALLHGHSFTGNALACAAACASLDLFEQPETWKNIHRIAHKHQQFSAQLAGHPRVRETRLLGTVFALEIETSEQNSYFASVRDRAYHYFLEQEMLIRPLGNVVFVNPPYCITDEQLDKVYTAIQSFLESLNEATCP